MWGQNWLEKSTISRYKTEKKKKSKLSKAESVWNWTSQTWIHITQAPW